MYNFSGYYDETTELLHIISGHPVSNHDYIEWPKLKRSRDYGMVTCLNGFDYFQLECHRQHPHSFVIDL
jgi:hypothetical protein